MWLQPKGDEQRTSSSLTITIAPQQYSTVHADTDIILMLISFVLISKIFLFIGTLETVIILEGIEI